MVIIVGAARPFIDQIKFIACAPALLIADSLLSHQLSIIYVMSPKIYKIQSIVSYTSIHEWAKHLHSLCNSSVLNLMIVSTSIWEWDIFALDR